MDNGAVQGLAGDHGSSGRGVGQKGVVIVSGLAPMIGTRGEEGAKTDDTSSTPATGGQPPVGIERGIAIHRRLGVLVSVNGQMCSVAL